MINNDLSAEQLQAKELGISTPCDSSSSETDILRKELRLLRQQSQQLIEQGKELVIAQKEGSTSSEFLASEVNITWKFVIFVLILILAFIGTLSHFWLSAPKDLELTRRLDEVMAQNKILRLEIDNLFQIIERLKESRYREQNDDNKPTFMKDREKLKVWPGNGKSFDQIEIPKVALKASYNCGDDEEDVAGFCVPSEKEIPPMREKSRATDPNKFSEKESSEKEDKQKTRNKQQHIKKKNYDSSEERRDKNNQSKERKNDKCKDCKKYSGERKGKNKKNYSKEQDGDWHDNMMKNREKQRKYKQKRDESDWSMERGDRREQ